jgi:hypothetical protein
MLKCYLWGSNFINVLQCRERQVSVALVWFPMFVMFIQTVISKHFFLLCIFTVSQILASGIATKTVETINNAPLRKYSPWNLHVIN